MEATSTAHTGVPARRQCGSYLPGHEVHWIQGIHSGRDIATARPGRLLDVQDNGMLVVDLEGAEFPFWNHEPRRLALLVDRNDGVVAVQWPRWHVLRTPSEGGQYVFNIAAGDNATPCPTGPPPADLVSQLLERGGFTVPGSALRPHDGET